MILGCTGDASVCVCDECGVSTKLDARLGTFLRFCRNVRKDLNSYMNDTTAVLWSSCNYQTLSVVVAAAPYATSLTKVLLGFLLATEHRFLKQLAIASRLNTTDSS